MRVFFLSKWGMSGIVDPGFGQALTWDIPLLEGYDHEFIPPKRELTEMKDHKLDNPGTSQALDKFQPDVVKVFGYGHRANWRAARWANRNKKPLLIYSDSNIKTQTPWKNLIKKPVVGYFYRSVDGALFVGDNNKAYHQAYGLKEDRLFAGCLPIDIQRLLNTVPDRAAARKSIRAQYGIPDEAFVLLFCGKFTAGKRPMDLLLAVHESGIESSRPLFALFVGDGQERPAMEQIIEQKNIQNSRIIGFVNQSRIGQYYCASDAVAITSSLDNHPLVVTEAAAFGLPGIVSDAIGCIGPTDTARDGFNVLVYRCGDQKGLATAIQKLVTDRDLYAGMSRNAVEIAATQDVTTAANQLAAAAHRLFELGKKR